MLVKRFIACLCYCKIAPWLFIRPTGRVFVEVNNAARQRKGRKANTRDVSSVMILLAGVKRESEEIDGNSDNFKTLLYYFPFLFQLGFKDTDGISFKLNKISDWSRKFMSKSDTDPEHFDVFSYITE